MFAPRKHFGDSHYDKNISTNKYYTIKPPFGTKICSDTCPRTLSVLRSSQVSWSFVLIKLIASRNRMIMSEDNYQSIFLNSNGGYCVYYTSNWEISSEIPRI